MKVNFKIGIVAILFAISTVTLFYSCKKAEQIISDKNSNQVENRQTLPANGFEGVSLSDKGFVVFNSEENYNNFLKVMKDLPQFEWDKWEKQMHFTSLRTAKNSQNKVTGINYNQDVEDDLLLTFIDQYGIVQIGNVIFKAEADIDFVWTLSASHLEKYGALLGRQFDANTMNIFRISLDENRTTEVWDIVNAGTKGIDESGNGGQGKTTAANSDVAQNEDHTYTTFTYHPTTGEITDSTMIKYRAHMKTSKQSALFYYSVLAEMKYMRRELYPTNSINWHQEVTTISMQAAWDFTRNPNNTIVQNSNYNPSSVYDNKINHRPYAGSKKVGSGWIDASFTWLDNGNNSQRSHTLPRNNF